ncbi:MAG: hypothetical protein ACJAUP_000799 [Cellvibrionaceae bacterium]|jgi:hypothetical protein
MLGFVAHPNLRAGSRRYLRFKAYELIRNQNERLTYYLRKGE